jgi:hypothetical protein
MQSAVLYAFLRGLDAPRYDRILGVWGLSREFVRTVTLMFQRQGFAYGDVNVKKSAKYNMVRLLVQIGRRETPSTSMDFEFLGPRFDYPSDEARARMSKIARDTLNAFHNADVGPFTQAVSDFLTAIPMVPLSKGREPAVVSIKTKMTPSYLPMASITSEIAAFKNRVMREIADFIERSRPKRPFADLEEIFDDLFVDDNLNQSNREIAARISARFPREPALMDRMRSFMQVKSTEYLPQYDFEGGDGDAYANLFSQLYAYFTASFKDTTLPVSPAVVVPGSPSVPRKGLSDSDIALTVTKYRYMRVEDMARLPLVELRKVDDFIARYRRADDVRSAEDIQKIQDSLIYAIEEKHYQDPSAFDPWTFYVTL